jgi:hypothetical protein
MLLIKPAVIGLLIASSAILACTCQAETLTPKDRKYLMDLARDTWNCIDYFRVPATGLPYDSNLRPDSTNTTNVGLYLVSVVAAQKMNFITPDQARQRVSKILSTLKRMKDWHGFLNNHINVNGSTQIYAGPNAVSDFNKLASALLVVRQAYPDLKEADELFRRIDWSALWDKSRDGIGLGYDITNGNLNDWGSGWYASDARMAFFLGVATGGLPAACMDRMERKTIKQYGLEFFQPSWNYAGLFMHAMDNMFMDIRDTDMGLSAANFAYAQILFSRERNYPAWGWSACNVPGIGYTIDGHLSESVVTPHASALMIEFYPRHVIANLKALEALGCRKPYHENGKDYAFGFRDSINMTTGEVSTLYFTSLDQPMLFISLANFLKEGCVRTLFESDPVARAGLGAIKYYHDRDTSQRMMFTQRDGFKFSATKGKAPSPVEDLVLDDAGSGKFNALQNIRMVRQEGAPNNALKFSTQQEDGQGMLQIEYNLKDQPKGKVVLTEPLNHLDAHQYNAVAFSCRGDNPDQLPMNFRLSLRDNLDSKNAGFVEGVGQAWQEVVFPLEMFRGVVADKTDLMTLEFRLEMSPEFMAANRLAAQQGVLYLRHVRLVSLPASQLKACVLAFKRDRELSFTSQGDVEGFGQLTGWQSFTDADAKFTLRNGADKGLKVEYQLGRVGKWVAWEKVCQESVGKNFTLSFEYRASGSSFLEIKLFADNGGVFGKTMPFQPRADWLKVVIPKNDLPRLWGGLPTDQLDNLRQIGMAVSGSPNASGDIEIRNVRIEKSK